MWIRTLVAGGAVLISVALPAHAQSYADSLAVLQSLGAALRPDARTVIQGFACYDGMHPCPTPKTLLPDPLLAAFAEHAGAQLVNDDRATIPPCPWGWDNSPGRPGYRMGVARLTLRGDTARVLILKHCDNPPGALHNIFGQDDEYTLIRGVDGTWAVRDQKMMRITRTPAHLDRAAPGAGLTVATVRRDCQGSYRSSTPSSATAKRAVARF